MTRLFATFAAFYGHIWRSQFKDEGFLTFAKEMWQEGLQDFSDVILAKAIRHCRSFYELPPTLPQMIQCCRDIKKQTSFFVVKIPHTVNRAVVSAHLNQCKAILLRGDKPCLS